MFNHQEIEKKWQKRWEEAGVYRVPNEVKGKQNHYTLVEFPYPSGNLHIGHWYAFAVPDIFARYKRMKGYNVLFPIGFDAFGLPAENAAIKHGLDPKKWTYENIQTMTRQLQSMGASFDWSRKVVACDPDYYRWTQWLFLQMYKKGMVYKKKAVVNWDPVDKTVLANEQVLPDGTAERSGAKVEKRELEQWFMRITDYADRLIEDLNDLPWPKEIKQSQRNWIGRSEGAEIDFRVGQDRVTVFTTRPDTLFGATYLVLAPEHDLVQTWLPKLTNRSEVEVYIEQTKAKKELERTAEGKDKTGVRLEGVMAINPANQQEIPVFIADYVLAGYGTGAIMAVPAHDERDFAFAKKFDLDILPVCHSEEERSDDEESVERSFAGAQDGKGCFTGSGTLINSGEFNSMSNEEAKAAITKRVGGRIAKTYRLRDWLISRQRYWGCPIPVVYDPQGKAHAIPDEHLPWLLPEDVSFEPTGTSPLGTSKELFARTEKIFGKGWKPELDTMDTFVDSSWYFLRYTDPQNEKEFASADNLKAWMPVNRYSGGAEHTTMHLLYSRFFHKALFDLGLVSQKEPYEERFNRGIILGTDGQKMSKRWGNVINPDEQVSQYGADAVRMYLAFIGPYNEVGHYPWQPGGLAGMRRFLDKVWKLSEKVPPLPKGGPGGVAEGADELDRSLHKTIKKVGEDIESFKFNTGISQMMILVNELHAQGGVSRTTFETLLKLLFPFAPHVSEELWEKLGHTTSLVLESWPVYDESKIKNDTVTLAVQVNGKLRGTIQIAADASEQEAKSLALQLENVAKILGEASIKKCVYVPGRILNLIV